MKFLFRALLPILAASMIACDSSKSKNQAISLYPVEVGGKFQYVTAEGTISINPQFENASVFSNGRALVQTSGKEPKWGYINEDGTFIIQPNFIRATTFSEGIAWVVSENGAPTSINEAGETIAVLQNAQTVMNYSEGLAAFSIHDSSGVKWGFVDESGTIKLAPQFVDVLAFSEGKCAVANHEGKWGYINTSGEVVINLQFDEAGQFIDGTAVVESNDKFGVIGEDGKFIINPQFDSMIHDGDYYLIEMADKQGWCDAEGKIIINPQFDEAYPFGSHDLAPIQSGENFGYCDREGKIVINPQFEAALPFNGNIAIVALADKIGFIDKEGKVTVNPQFDDIALDLFTILLNGQSVFTRIETDYFDIKTILQRIDVEKPEGLSLGTPVSNAVKLLEVDQEKFSLYGNEHQVLFNEEITNDAALDFYLFGDFSKEVMDGWYPRLVFDPEAPMEGFAYVIELKRNGEGKEQQVLDSIEKSLTGFVLDESQSSDERKVFSKGNVSVALSLWTGKPLILISKSKQ